MTCTITRIGGSALSGEVNPANSIGSWKRWSNSCTRANNVPTGTVLLTGTGIIVPQDAALAPGDVVTISVPEIGDLTNQVRG